MSQREVFHRQIFKARPIWAASNQPFHNSSNNSSRPQWAQRHFWRESCKPHSKEGDTLPVPRDSQEGRFHALNPSRGFWVNFLTVLQLVCRHLAKVQALSDVD